MIRAFLATLLGVSIITGSLVAQPPKGKDPPKKEAPKEKPKDAPKAKTPAGKELTGMFKTKDDSKKTLTIIVDGKDKVFKVTDATKFTGPLVGSDDKLKDDRLDRGYKITVVADAKEEGTAAEVKLPFRNEREGGDKKTDDKKKMDDKKKKG